jgi:hypothetical protein
MTRHSRVGPNVGLPANQRFRQRHFSHNHVACCRFHPTVSLPHLRTLFSSIIASTNRTSSHRGISLLSLTNDQPVAVALVVPIRANPPRRRSSNRTPLRTVASFDRHATLQLPLHDRGSRLSVLLSPIVVHQRARSPIEGLPKATNQRAGKKPVGRTSS